MRVPSFSSTSSKMTIILSPGGATKLRLHTNWNGEMIGYPYVVMYCFIVVTLSVTSQPEGSETYVNDHFYASANSHTVNSKFH